MTNGTDLAFSNPGSDYISASDGLTKREYFAAMAMQGLLGNERILNDGVVVANTSVLVADALIEALNKEAK